MEEVGVVRGKKEEELLIIEDCSFRWEEDVEGVLKLK